MTVSQLAGLRLSLEDHDDPTIVVRPMYRVERRYGEFGRPLPTSTPNGSEISYVEILVMNEEGVGVYLQLGYEIFLELYEKMSGIVPDGQDTEVSSNADN